MGNNVIAQTILEQLGGANRLAVMIGANSFTADQNTLSFKFKARSSKVSRSSKVVGIRIDLMPSDTYKVQLIIIKRDWNDDIRVKDDVYADNLIAVCEELTGLAFRL